MQLSWSEIYTVTKATLLQGRIQGAPEGFSIDTRTLTPGDVFIALPGEKTDGHKFLPQALEKGASGAIVKSGYNVPARLPAGDDRPIIAVADPETALQSCAAYYRSKFDITVVGITGSSGKTTTKDLTAAVLEQKFSTLKTSGNYNNQLGLPLVLLKLDSRHQAAVLEMGMSSLGEIELLAKVARPSIGVITNIGEAHLEKLGSREAIARAKGELILGLTGRRLAVLNGDDPRQRQLARDVTGEILFYGLGSDCHLRAENIRHSLRWVEFSIPGQRERYRVSLPGKHNIYNGLAAAAVGFSLGLTGEQVRQGLIAPAFSGMRMDFIPLAGSGIIINDAYNANPDSMTAALQVLRSFNPPRIAVLGDMLELGDIAAEAHRRIGAEAAGQQLDLLVLLGEMAPLYREGAVAGGMPPEKTAMTETHQEAVKILLSHPDIHDAAVLVKGSRGMALEKVVNGLVQAAGGREKDGL